MTTEIKLTRDNGRVTGFRNFKRRVRACGADEFRFLTAAGAGTLSPDSATQEQVDAAYESIPSASWAELDTLLKKKEARPK